MGGRHKNLNDFPLSNETFYLCNPLSMHFVNFENASLVLKLQSSNYMLHKKHKICRGKNGVIELIVVEGLSVQKTSEKKRAKYLKH